ncbi:MAG: EAL domain-containing protein, partial [Psychrobium sp.]
MKKRTQKQLYIAASAALVLIFFIFLSYLNVLSHWHYQANIVKQKLIEQSRQTNIDLQNYLAPLNKKFRGETCTPQVLDAMREAQYYAEKLHEFSFVVDNKLICSANVGILAKPIKQPTPDIVDAKSKVSFTRLAPIGILPGNDKAVRLRIGNFQALLKINSQSTLTALGLQAVIFVYDGTRFLKAYTNQYDWLTPLSSQPHVDTISRIQNGKWLQQFCYAPQTCALLKIDIKTFLKRHALLLSLSTLIIFGLCIAIFAKCYREIQTYFSFNAQVKRGINQNQVVCYYQPIIDNSNGKVSSCEVLCRWRDNGGDLHGAFPFIEAVINNGQEAALTSIIVKNAIEDFKRHGLLGKTKLSINCFPNDVANG